MTAALASLSALIVADAFAAAAASKSKPAAKPAKKRRPPSPPKPSAASNELARWLQRTLRKANLSNALTEKIAGDIESGLDITKAFAKSNLANADEPDFTFLA